MPFLEVTILFSPETPEKSGMALKKDYLFSPETPKNPKSLMHFSTVPCLPCIWYCKYAEYACKFQTNLSMNNKTMSKYADKFNIVL